MHHLVRTWAREKIFQFDRLFTDFKQFGLHFCRFERNLRDLEAASVLGKMENFGGFQSGSFFVIFQSGKEQKEEEQEHSY